MFARLTVPLCCLILATLVAACSDPASTKGPPLQHAERVVDGFYAFEPEPLVAELALVPARQRRGALYYQAWAEAGHYQIKQRRPCSVVTELPDVVSFADAPVNAPIAGSSATYIACAVTVTDDLGRAMNYVATDTFWLQFDAAELVGLAFSADDPPIFQAVFAFIAESRPEVMSGPCEGMFDTGTTPGACVRAVVAAAQAYVKQQPTAVP